MHLLIGHESDKACRIVKEVVDTRFRAVFRCYFMKNLVGIGCIPWFAPFLGCEEEGCDKIDFSIGGIALPYLRSVECTLPAEVAIPWAISRICHVGFGPSPEFVEHLTFIELQTDHHAIRHTLRADIVTASIYDDAHRVAHLVIDTFLAIGIILTDVARGEEVRPYTVNTCLYLCLTLAKECREEVV